MSTIAVSLPRLAPGLARLRRALETDALPIGAIAACTAMLTVALPVLLVQDSWLALVDGRLIATTGLPHVDTLTHWTLGRHWIDQQWGAQLVLYEIAARFGLRAVALFGVGCVVAALVAAGVVARRLGASPRSTAIGLVLPLVCAPWLAQVRTQSLALLPFVVVLGLLARDCRRSDRRVYLVLPLLVVWANLHGSVAVAAAIVALYGLVRQRPLLLLAPLCLLASPYGTALVGYYRLMLFHPPLASFVREWRPPGGDSVTVPFFVSVAVLGVLWARHRRMLTSFEQWVLPLLLVAALDAVRNVIWFELAAAIALPRLLDAAWAPRALSADVRRVNLVAASAAVMAVLLFVFLHRPVVDPDRSAAATVAAAAGADGIVLADDGHADWLLWEQPSLVGRIAYDVRFELFDRGELGRLTELEAGSARQWRACGSAARVITYATPTAFRRAARAGGVGRRVRTIVDLPRLVAVTQSPRPGQCGI